VKGGVNIYHQQVMPNDKQAYLRAVECAKRNKDSDVQTDLTLD
jgi:hypothetical protein